MLKYFFRLWRNHRSNQKLVDHFITLKICRQNVDRTFLNIEITCYLLRYRLFCNFSFQTTEFLSLKFLRITY